MDKTPDGVIARKEGTIQQGDMTLSYASVIPAHSKAALLIVHGMNDHKQRYAELQAELAAVGFASFAYDQRGFGCSGGKRSDVEHYEDYLEDLKAVLVLLRKSCPSLLVFLLGHSLGGLISASYCVKNPKAVDALVLSSPAYLVAPLPFPLENLVNLLNRLMPKTAMPYPHRHHYRSHDPAIIAAVENDPLIAMNATPRFYIQFRKMNRFLLDHAGEMDLPTLILQAGDDQIVSPEGAKMLYACLKNPVKKLICYEAFYHEVFHEVERQRVVRDLIQWLESTLPMITTKNGEK